MKVHISFLPDLMILKINESSQIHYSSKINDKPAFCNNNNARVIRDYALASGVTVKVLQSDKMIFKSPEALKAY